MVHPPPQTPQGESVAKPETLLLIIISLVCKHDTKDVFDYLSSKCFQKVVRGHKYHRKVDKEGTLSHILIISH